MNELLASRAEVERLFGQSLEWNPPDDRRRSGAVLAIGDGDITEVDRHELFADWFIDTGDKLRMALEGLATRLRTPAPSTRAVVTGHEAPRSDR
jgi:hypothetical protein